MKTRKILTSTGSFHIKSDVDRLYAHRDKGGRGLNSLVDIYIARVISISWHLKEASSSNPYLALVQEHETGSLIRVAKQLTECFDVEPKETDTAKTLSKQVKEKMKDNHLQEWIEKPQPVSYTHQTLPTKAKV